ncbi:unnamed protein product [Rhizophagus irregularis]|nr:unnamed protein product [Rhizophagus irregularis]
MKKDSFGVWEVHIPAKNGTPTIPHNIKIKISMTTSEGERIDHLPAWIKRVTQDLNFKIYEAHEGISRMKPGQNMDEKRMKTGRILI